MQDCFNSNTDELSQKSLEAQRSGATIIPLIISSDKTQLTVFGGKMAYPVYMTIGNIPKEIRRKPSRHAMILIGYIPMTKLESIGNKAARRRALTNLFHFCMQTLLGPIASLYESGLPIMSGDGIWHRCHPILANFIGDYPEQVLVTCTYYGECPKCEVPHDQLGEHDEFLPRDHGKALSAYALADEDVCEFHRSCKENGIKPVFHPFWESLPELNMYASVTPDVLHQLLQGVMKHLIAWLSDPLVFGPWGIDV